MTTAEEEFVRENIGKMTIEQMGIIILLANLLHLSPKTIEAKGKSINNDINKFIVEKL